MTIQAASRGAISPTTDQTQSIELVSFAFGTFKLVRLQIFRVQIRCRGPTSLLRGFFFTISQFNTRVVLCTQLRKAVRDFFTMNPFLVLLALFVQAIPYGMSDYELDYADYDANYSDLYQGYDDAYSLDQDYDLSEEEYYDEEERVPSFSGVAIGTTTWGGDLVGGTNPTSAQAIALERKRTAAKTAIGILLGRARSKLTASGCAATVNIIVLNDLHGSRSEPRMHYTFRTTSGCTSQHTGHAFADGTGDIFNGAHQKVYP
jgi:hypothetical protein